MYEVIPVDKTGIHLLCWPRCFKEYNDEQGGPCSQVQQVCNTKEVIRAINRGKEVLWEGGQIYTKGLRKTSKRWQLSHYLEVE